MNTLQNGQQGEQAACDYLQRLGYRILQRNFRKPCGEVDIIAKDKNTLVFIEVKKRASMAFGGPAAAVTLSKQRKIVLTAQYYLKENASKFDSIRFDVVCLLPGKLEHIPNAFYPPRGTF